MYCTSYVNVASLTKIRVTWTLALRCQDNPADLTAQSGAGACTLDKRMIHVPGGTERDGTRCHPATRNGTRFETDVLLVSGIFHFTFSDRG